MNSDSDWAVRIVQEVESALAPVQELLRSCQASFAALVLFFGEQPLSANETEFWSGIRTFLRACGDSQRIKYFHRGIFYGHSGDTPLHLSTIGHTHA